MGSGQRWATTRLWDGVDLRFWVKHRRIMGDVIFWELTGTVPSELRVDAGPQPIEGVTNVAEASVFLLGATSHTLFHFLVITAPDGSQDENLVRSRMVLFVRARRIRKQLELIAGEKHEGRYKQFALTTAVMLAADQRLAEIALSIESGDWGGEQS
jgi:hypothetical protein